MAIYLCARGRPIIHGGNRISELFREAEGVERVLQHDHWTLSEALILSRNTNTPSRFAPGSFI
eukprot:2516814-Prymnesium_polylepis.2